jgi:hypothetical protein
MPPAILKLQLLENPAHVTPLRRQPKISISTAATTTRAPSLHHESSTWP